MLSICIPAPLLPAVYPELSGQSLQLSHSPGLVLHPGPSGSFIVVVSLFSNTFHSLSDLAISMTVEINRHNLW